MKIVEEIVKIAEFAAVPTLVEVPSYYVGRIEQPGPAVKREVAETWQKGVARGVEGFGNGVCCVGLQFHFF